jgi:glutamyl/glutaminyl-tRNA synthetase
MAITDVFRGEEHLSNTPRQLLLLQALGAERPRYAHLPLIIGQDRAKLSKRKHREARLELFQELGYLPEAMVNYLALLGWNPGTEREVFSLDELVEAFDLARVQRSGAVFDWDKLDWIDGHYIRALDDAELAARLEPYLPELTPERVRQAAPALKERLPRLAAARDLLEYLWTDPPAAELDAEAQEKVAAAVAALGAVEWLPGQIESALEGLREERGWSRNQLFKPIRLAATGRQVSPPIHDTLALLPKADALARLARVLP